MIGANKDYFNTVVTTFTIQFNNAVTSIKYEFCSLSIVAKFVFDLTLHLSKSAVDKDQIIESNYISVSPTVHK